MPKLNKIESSVAFTPEAGNIVTYFAEESDKIVLKAKKSDGTVQTLSGGGGGESGGSADFYQCAAVHGPRKVTYINVSGAGTTAVNGDYEKTSFTSGTGGEVWKHLTSDYYCYQYSEYWCINADYNTYGEQALYYSYDGENWYTGYNYETDTQTGESPAPTVTKRQDTLDADVPKTWDGYKAVLTDGFYTFEETVTSGLTYSAYTPTIGKVYPADMTGVFSPFADPSNYFVLNDDDTLILYYPQSSGGEVVNIGAGAAKLLHTPNINSVTVSDGKMVFDGNGYISFPANTFPEGIFSNGEWTMDIWYDVDWTSRTTQIIFGRGESPRYDIFVGEDGSIRVGGGPTLVNSRTPENRRRFTLEVWDNSGTLTWTSYINGVKQLEGTWGTTNLRTAELWLGGDPTSGTSRNIIGTIAHFSIRAKADHKGHNFEVTETPYA